MPIEVTVWNPGSWSGRGRQLARILAGIGPRGPLIVPDAEGGTDPDVASITLVDPGAWSCMLPELEEALSRSASAEEQRAGAGRASGIAADSGGGRLTLSVEEAARALGISRALAYEAVARKEIPHIRVGRRILVPRSALQALLDSATTDPQ